MNDPAPPSGSASLFDLRSVIAALFGIYGAILTVLGIVATDAADLEKAGGVALNLWTGIGMLVIAALFVLWVVLRPSTVGATQDPDQAVRGDRPGGQ